MYPGPVGQQRRFRGPVGRTGKQPGQDPRRPYPIEEWEVVEQEGVGEGACAKDLTEPRALQLGEPGGQEAKAGHPAGAGVEVRGGRGNVSGA